MTLMDCYNKIKNKYKITFISTIFFGLLSQGMGLFNKYSFHDDISWLFGVGATYMSGRWMLDIVSQWEMILFGDGHFSMPVINGFIAITFIGIAACYIVALLDIENQVFCVFVGGIMVTFPVVTGIFGYMYTLPYYMLAMLIGIMGAYCFCKMKRWWKVIGIALMAMSVGIYQAFAPVTICALLFYAILELERKHEEPIQSLKKVIAIGLSVVGFMAIYFGMNAVFMVKYNVQLTPYQGINRMGAEPLTEYIDRAIYAYKEFFVPTTDTKYYMYQANIRNIYTIVIVAGILLSLMMIIKVYVQNRLRGCILGGLFFLVPLATNFIFVMAFPSDVHALMVYAQMMPFILFACLLDRFEMKVREIAKLVKICFALMLLFLVIMYCRIDNKCYLKAEFSQQKAISYFTTLITQIKCADGYIDGMPISFINARYISDSSIYEMDDLDYIQIAPYWGMSDYINDYAWIQFMKRWCGYSPDIIDGTDIIESEEVKNMPSYPNQGSIRVIDNRVVVKF